MSPDIALALGIFLSALAVTSALAAFAERRRPVVACLLALGAGWAIVFAWQGSEDGYRLADIPMVFYEVIAALR
ncbi:hypothetical protein SAMN05421759_11542 [Roseivivax lentus]|uniref:Uncharacterized protein n=1 Tax=Roseivivax lentus TaxID=633194 RepID=A0A1N7PFR5_9RHOB|nr:hypothetical protein [Roseivivax lentus]SIT09386.1 hypothetical protein SAMN05421759_11542 [Roseivivax lentus]